jgi:hypothetical protein
MHLKTSNAFKRCQVKDCENYADFELPIKGVFKNKMYLCEVCLKKMFKSYMATNIPKPIESPFKINNRIRKEKKWKKWKL